MVAELGREESQSKYHLCSTSGRNMYPLALQRNVLLTAKPSHAFISTGPQIYGSHQVRSQRASSCLDRGSEAGSRGCSGARAWSGWKSVRGSRFRRDRPVIFFCDNTDAASISYFLFLTQIAHTAMQSQANHSSSHSSACNSIAQFNSSHHSYI